MQDIQEHTTTYYDIFKHTSEFIPTTSNNPFEPSCILPSSWTLRRLFHHEVQATLEAQQHFDPGGLNIKSVRESS